MPDRQDHLSEAREKSTPGGPLMKKLRTSGRVRSAVVVVAVAAFASLGGVGYAAGLVHFKHASSASAEYPPAKVTICHHTHSQHNPFVTITVSEHAVPAHLGHGDTIGACSEQQQGSAQTQTGAPKKEKPVHQSHGKSAAAHARNAARKAARSDTKAGKGNGGQAHGNSGTHGKGHGQNAHGHGQGKGKGHDKNPNHGNGHGQGHGQGHGPGGNHGNSGGGKGNGHKP